MTDNAFAAIPATPAGHFKLYYYGAILRVIDRLFLLSESQEAALERFPFLLGYINELASCGLDGSSTDVAQSWWRDQVEAWEADTTMTLPIRSLQSAAGLSYETTLAYFCLSLGEEDPRFGVMFDALQGNPGQHLLTYGMLNSWAVSADELPRTALQELQDAALIRIPNSDAPRFDWALQPNPLLWDVICGRGTGDPTSDSPREIGNGLTYHPPASLLRFAELIVPAELGERLYRLPDILASRDIDVLLVRGPRHNGRKSLLGAVAAELGYGVLEVPRRAVPSGAPVVDDPTRVAGPLATLLHALPVVTYDLAPGETTQPPRLSAYRGPLGVAMGAHGGLLDAGQILTLRVDMPAPGERLVHWQRALAGANMSCDPQAIAGRFRLTSGAIYRTAALARTWATLATDGTDGPARAAPLTVDHVQEAVGALNRQSLDTLAHQLPATGVWSDLAVRAETADELLLLESRCRHREQLALNLGSRGASTTGVRALFTGPSGTGKTFAARILAAALKMDLYRVDLSSVVNKYIGETEKNLNELFTRAEELDVVLLIDEGDALLTQRTNVQTSNDRYANLETNFLLQRLETYDGIVIVTTNAGERIDSAFQRRMDVVVEFRAPEPAERFAIWQLHLPETHGVDSGLLRDLASRCQLTGGQIRNTALHASVLALANGGRVTSEHLETAVRREYRKTGGVYPLRTHHG